MSQAFVAVSSPLGESKPLRPNLLRAVFSDTALVIVKFVALLPVVALDDLDLLVVRLGSQRMISTQVQSRPTILN